MLNGSDFGRGAGAMKTRGTLCALLALALAGVQAVSEVSFNASGFFACRDGFIAPPHVSACACGTPLTPQPLATPRGTIAAGICVFATEGLGF